MDKYERVEELKNCDFVKTVLMLLVVLYHSCRFWNYNWNVFLPIPELDISVVSQMVIEWSNTWRIYAFTLVSGYLFYHLRYEKDRYSVFWSFLQKKIQRLLVPAYFVGMVWVVPIYVYFCGDSANSILNFVLGIKAVQQLWFLFMLFDVFMMAYIIGENVHDNRLCWFITIFVYFIGFVGRKFIPNVYQLWTACYYFPLFVVGMKLREGCLNFLRDVPLLIWVLCDICLFVITRALSGPQVFLVKVANVVFLRLAVHIVGALMAFFILQKIASLYSWEDSKLFMFLKRHNVTVYLFHEQVIYFVIIWLNGVINPYLHMGLNYVISLSCALLVAVVLAKFRITRFLIGMK